MARTRPKLTQMLMFEYIINLLNSYSNMSNCTFIGYNKNFLWRVTLFTVHTLLRDYLLIIPVQVLLGNCIPQSLAQFIICEWIVEITQSLYKFCSVATPQTPRMTAIVIIQGIHNWSLVKINFEIWIDVDFNRY